MVARSGRWPKLFELFVLAACVILLAGLFLPAVNYRPRSARRTQCANALKNLALATANFETAKNRYPGYQQQFGIVDGQGAKIGSWFVAIMPYVEQQALRDLWDDRQEQEMWRLAAKGDETQLARFYPAIPWLHCASDPTPTAKFGPISYVANTGFYLLPNDAALGLEAYTPAQSDSERSTISQRPANGIFNNQLPVQVLDPITGKSIAVFGPADQTVSSADVRDGLSNTLLFAENTGSLSWRDTSIHHDQARLQLGMVWLYAGNNASAGRPQPMAVAELMRMSASRDGQSPTAYTAHPASGHSGVYNVAMADGSVVSLSKDLDYHVYQALMTPQSRQSDVPDTNYLLKDDDYRQ